MNNIFLVKLDGSEELVDINSFQNLKISIKGNDNTVKIGENTRFINSNIVIDGNNNFLSIGSSKGVLTNVTLSMPCGLDNRTIKIGNGFESGFCLILNNVQNKGIYIGNECLFSENIHIRAGDGHTIYDMDNKNPINQTEGDLVIGNHVWVGRSVYFGKDSGVADNTVVGYGSLVTKKFSDANIVIAGNPARVIRTNTNWSKQSVEKYLEITNEKKIIAVIPSRYGSSRYPGKPLAMILGKPMIQWVYERVLKVNEISEAYVATDDERIYNAVIGFGGKAVMTGDCSCGTDRVYQACKDIDCDIVLNIQGDEPMIKPEMIRDLISAFDDPDVKMATLKKEIVTENDINNPNIAKLITDSNRNAIYFSRSTIPYNRDGNPVKYFKHIGVYGYKKSFLKEFVSLPKSALEEAEQLEQLRAIENGYKIRVIETQHQSIGVDLPEHIGIVEAELKKELGL